MLEGLVELIVEMCQPELTILRLSLFGDRLNNFTDLLKVGPPQFSIIEQIDVHKLIDHFHSATVNVAQFTILSDKCNSLSLHFLIILLDFDWIVPGDHTLVDTSVAFGILDQMLKLGHFVDHHGLLTVDHLSAHGVEEVGGLFEREAFLVELLGVLGDGVDRLGNLEAMFTQDSSVFDKSDELGRVVNFKKATCLIIELHELSTHFKFLLLVLVLHLSLDAIDPGAEQVVLEVFDGTHDLI